MDGRILWLFISFSLISTACGVRSGTSQSDPTQRYIVKFRTSPFRTSAPLNTPASAFIATPTASYLQNTAGPGATSQRIINTTYLVQIPDDTDPTSTIAQLEASQDVEYIEPDPIAYALHVPNDPSYASQWFHKNINSEQAWDIGSGSRNVLVAVIDSGVDYNHPDLRANIWSDPKDGSHGWNFVDNNSDPMADDASAYHGTHVAGIIGAQEDNGVGIAGVSPQVTILPLKFLDSRGQGSVSNAIRAIYFAIRKGARIMSNSWGSSQPSQALAEAIDTARQAGILFVAAAGNGGSDGVGDNNDQSPTYPAGYGYDNVISVAATDRSDQLTRFSNYGPSSVHVAAPGSEIYSTKNGSEYQTLSGTSMATPIVSGVAALMFAYRPDLTYSDIKRAIIENVDVVSSLQGRVASNGRINAHRAMMAMSNAGPGPNPTPSPIPTPVPTPTPTPTYTPPPQPPIAQIARPPLLAGVTQLLVTNPYAQIPIDIYTAEFPGTQGMYLEVSRPNAGFINPNGLAPDPNRLTYTVVQGVMGRVFLIPLRDLPGWGTYQIRVIPINGVGQPMGAFSNASVLMLRPY